MFDKLIVSEPEGADFKTRRSYFMVSSLVVGIVFATAVVISIFAADIGLGSSSFELVEMIAPPEMVKVEPETPQPRPPTVSQTQSQLPSRQVNMARVDESPIAPATISVVPNNQVARPRGQFEIGLLNTDPVAPSGNVRGEPGTGTETSGLQTKTEVIESTPLPDPPRVKVVPPPVKRVVSGGVLNGKATHLPVPTYPAAARAVNLTGKVDVQVTIDEAGNVVSASAVSGHAMLRGTAVQAARNAKFSTTYLSKVPVKVTGVIVYNFAR